MKKCIANIFFITELLTTCVNTYHNCYLQQQAYRFSIVQIKEVCWGIYKER